ncbi:uncharacterized protein LAESUDRAFT_3009 [Laetiporus sulphureus 93-53]|uniref:Uncharacterized protein n=1 Tax=Laetiporus sulphureus 93-53 TaxID=1314785 RepID=A0A165I2M1_9APHY|nr:uncharacterized protein LAESUDRAFT_3009 [Laetiporus sulphureus 93-53]KZT12508.1 hypothetical protein LAESUDRAFT_3009 [Laetiporus sulphureus 93-53]
MTTFVMRLPLSESALRKETSLPVSSHEMARCGSCNIALAPDHQSKLCRVCQNIHTLRNQRMTLANCASCKAVVQVPAAQVAPPQPVICATCRQPRSQASPTRGNAQPTNPMMARPPAPNPVDLDDTQFAAFIANAAAQFVHPAHIHLLYNERIGAPLKRPKSHYGPLPESRMKPVVNVPPPGTPHLNSRGEYLWPHLLPSRCSSVYPFPPLPTPQSMLPFIADHADSVAVSRWRQSSSLPTDWTAIATPVISPSILVKPSSQPVSPAQILPANFSDQRKRTIRLCEMHGCSTILSPGHPFEMCSKHISFAPFAIYTANPLDEAATQPIADHPIRRMSNSSLPSDCLHPAHVQSLSSSLTDTLTPAMKPRLRVYTQSNGSIRIDPPVSATEVGSANESPSMLDSYLPTSRQAYSLAPAGSRTVGIGSQPRSLPSVVASTDRSMQLTTEPLHPKKQESTEMETEQMLRHIELLLQGHREARRMSQSSRGLSHGSIAEEAVRRVPELATVIADVPMKDALHPLKQEGSVVAVSESKTQDVPFALRNDADTSLPADRDVMMDTSAEQTSDEAADTTMSHNQHDSDRDAGEINLTKSQETSSASNTVSSLHSPHSSLSSKRTSPQTSPITQFGDLPNSSATQDVDGDLSDLTPLEGSTDEGESEIEMKDSSSDDEEDIPLAKQLLLVKRRRQSSTIDKPVTKCSVRHCHNLLLPGTKRKPCESCRQKNCVLQNRRRAMVQVEQAECDAPQKQEKLPRISENLNGLNDWSLLIYFFVQF